jgi:adenylate cyclase
MALQASANVGAIKAASGLPTWLRGIGARQVRLACGLVMFTYIFLHFFNHALGIISFDTMEAWLQWHLWWWRIPVVNGTLYTAAAIHLSLGLWALYQRRHFRYAAAEIAQLVLGFSIPLLLASHFGGERVAGWIYGRVPVSYAPPLFGYWITRPYMVAVQFTLLTVAWTHACIGLYFWLRLKSFFKWAWPMLFAVAILLPPLAMIGTYHGAQEVIQLVKQPQWRILHINPIPPPQRAVIDQGSVRSPPSGF